MKIEVKRTTHVGQSFDRLPQLLPDQCIRAAVLASDVHGITVETVQAVGHGCLPDIGHFVARDFQRDREFVAVLVIPTGIGCEIGGHAGDAGAVARLLGGVTDTLVLHPNVVNGCDINEMPANALYVEGAALTQFMMGQIGLARSRRNQIGLYVEEHPNDEIAAWTLNSANAARRCYGATIEVCRGPSLGLATRMGGDGLPIVSVGELGPIRELMDDKDSYVDAWAIASQIDMDSDLGRAYFAGEMKVNPWGAVEAALTHTLGLVRGVPVAHAPMVSDRAELDLSTGVVDPRMAAEAVSVTYINCVLKGLTRAPQLLEPDHPNVDLTVSDVDALVIPRGVLGLPVWAAREQGIPVIEVRDNHNLMDNDLTALSWSWGYGTYYQVGSYMEAAGVLAALRAGVDPRSTA